MKRTRKMTLVQRVKEAGLSQKKKKKERENEKQMAEEELLLAIVVPCNMHVKHIQKKKRKGITKKPLLQ